MTFNAKLLTATAAALIGAIALTGSNEAPAPAPAAESAALADGLRRAAENLADGTV